MFDDEVAVGFALDIGEEDISALQRPGAKLTEDGAYPVRLKVGDGETLVTGDVASDDLIADRPPSETPKVIPETQQGRQLAY